MGLFAKEVPADPEYAVTVTTTDHIAGRDVKEYLGIVSGRGFISEIFVTADTDSAQTETRKIMRQAEQNLKAEAAALGANAVIGVTVQHTKARAAMLIVMSGTAVILD